MTGTVTARAANDRLVAVTVWASQERRERLAAAATTPRDDCDCDECGEPLSASYPPYARDRPCLRLHCTACGWREVLPGDERPGPRAAGAVPPGGGEYESRRIAAGRAV